MSTEKKVTIPTPADLHAATHAKHSKAKLPDHPTLIPPSVAKAGVHAAALVTGQQVTQIFGSANTTNQWLNITNAGWLKISTDNANAHMAMNVIGCFAYQTQGTIYYSLNAANQVQEIYAW